MNKLTFNNICGDRLLEERKRLGFTQQEMAELIGVQQTMPGRYERGQASPGGDVLVAFAAIGGDVQYVLTGIRSSLALTSDEEELLTGYRALDIRGKAGMLGMVDGLATPVKSQLGKSSRFANTITGTNAQAIQGGKKQTNISGNATVSIKRKKKDDL